MLKHNIYWVKPLIDLIMWSLPSLSFIVSKSFLQQRLWRYLDDALNGVVRALLVPEVTNQLPVSGGGADSGRADDVGDGGLQGGVGAPAGGVYFEAHMLAILLD